jgi:hypothetical protein
MSDLNFSFEWNGILEKKKLYIDGVKAYMNRGDPTWCRDQTPRGYFKYKNETTEAERVTSIETSCAVIGNSLVIGLIHNDKQMSTIILSTIESSPDIVCRIGHFTDVGEFCELFYEETEYDEERSILVWGVDDYPEDLFRECC